MGGTITRTGMLKEYGKREKIAFGNLFAAVCYEEITRRMVKSGKKGYYLKKPYVFSMEGYREEILDKLEWYLVEEEPQGEAFQKEWEEILEKEEEVFSFEIIDTVQEGEKIQIYLEGHLEEIVFPLLIVLEKTQKERLFTEEKSFTALLDGEDIFFQTVCREQVLAQDFVEIMNRLEFIEEMEPFEEIYKMAHRENLSGRKMREIMEQLLFQEVSEKQRKNENFLTVVQYEENTYMEQKWKRYLSRKKQKTPKWKEMMEIFKKLFIPIWESILREEVFLGDWMGEISRYLE